MYKFERKGEFLRFIVIAILALSLDFSMVTTKAFGDGVKLKGFNHGGKTYVTAYEFCKKLNCNLIYQWSKFKLIIENPKKRISAIVSPISSVALVDGYVDEINGSILSNIDQGYSFPAEFAQNLSSGLGLNSIEFGKDPLINSKFAIIIDPGHGGSDHGTKHGSIYEKNLALNFAKALKVQLEKDSSKFEVYITRQKDAFVSLHDRASFANSKGEGLFISLHMNHSPSVKIEGIETYILSTDATDDEAKRTAVLENDSWIKTMKIKEDQYILKQIFADMEQTKYIQNSALGASLIHQELKNMKKSHEIRNRGVKQAMFYVLSQVAMPSVLIEIGFLSNENDRRRLLDVAFQREFVKSLASGIKKYRERINP